MKRALENSSSVNAMSPKSYFFNDDVFLLAIGKDEREGKGRGAGPFCFEGYSG